MIVIDTSALIAILIEEPEKKQFLEIIADADRRLMSAVSLLEARLVIFARRGEGGVVGLHEWLAVFDAEIVPFDAGQCELAFAAFKSYGKGIDPRTRLNMGDCAAYALAKSRNAPLLFKGTDFSATDIQPASQS